MARLGNLPTINLMVENQDGEDYFSYFKDKSESEKLIYEYSAFPELLVKKLTNKIRVKDNATLICTDFQAKIYHHLVNGENVTLSAPTSTGKSYVIHAYIGKKISENNRYCAVYIAPTKALIAEVQSKIEEATTSLGVKPSDFGVFISANSINFQEINKIARKVFVLTQERLQEAMANNPIRDVDLLVVDEAQKIGDEGRGVVIEDSVQELIESSPLAQKVIISPYADNPERFGPVFGIYEGLIPEKTSLSPVAQNIFKINFENNKKVTISLHSWDFDVSDESKILKEISVKGLPTAKSRRKAWVVNNIIPKGEPTIVYCDQPYHCRLVAQNIAEESEKTTLSKEVEEAIKFFSEYVHEEYYLCDSLKSRIGYHYGKMPQFVRFQVKELFENRHIDLICCTSTLLEGVNLPAKNMVLYNPKAGEVMDRLSVLNLAGRAGRLRSDYYGKIYCINMNEWENKEDIFADKLEEIKSSVEQTLTDDVKDLIGYLKDLTYQPAEGRLKEGVKTLATSLLMKQLKNPTSNFLESFQKRQKKATAEDLTIIKELLASKCAQLMLDHSVILKNRSIDPRFQDELYVGLRGSFDSLPFPDDPYFYVKLRRIFEKISQYILRNDVSIDHRHEYYAFLAWRWILEDPYKVLLEGKIVENKRYGKDKQTAYKTFINRMIDELDNDIEDVLKYDYTRGLKCYNDIIEFIMEKTGLRKWSCKELNIYLEEGTCNRNTLFLLEVGFSRNLAIEIARHIKYDLDDSASCVKWAVENKRLLQSELRPILFKELEDVLAKFEVAKTQA